jgi:hypothetical protein
MYVLGPHQRLNHEPIERDIPSSAAALTGNNGNDAAAFQWLDHRLRHPILRNEASPEADIWFEHDFPLHKKTWRCRS